MLQCVCLCDCVSQCRQEEEEAEEEEEEEKVKRHRGRWEMGRETSQKLKMRGTSGYNMNSLTV